MIPTRFCLRRGTSFFQISLLTSCLSSSYGDTVTGTSAALMQRDTSFPANTQLIMFFHEVDSLVTAACLFDTGADCSFQCRPPGRRLYIRRRFHRVTRCLHQPRSDTHFLLITAHIHLSARGLKRWPLHFPRSLPCHRNCVRLPSRFLFIWLKGVVAYCVAAVVVSPLPPG